MCCSAKLSVILYVLWHTKMRCTALTTLQGPTAWLYLVAAGLTQTEDSTGFETTVFAPPPQLIAQALTADTPSQWQSSNSSLGLRHASASKQTLRGTLAVEWSLPKEPRVNGFCYSGVCEASQLHESCAEASSLTKQYLPLHLGCPNYPMNNITSIDFAEWGDGRGAGNCSSGARRLRNGSCAFDLKQAIAGRCVGQTRCTVMCGYTYSSSYGYSPGVGSDKSGCVITIAGDGPPPFFHGATFIQFPAPHYDPCFGTPGWYSGYLSLRLSHSCGDNRGTVLSVKVTVPPNTAAVTRLPLLGSPPSAVDITEGTGPSERQLWRSGAFVPGVAGVATARLVLANSSSPRAGAGDIVEVIHGSGTYQFTRRG